ncbi:YbaB/EbfC family nucleoid-associated protein [Nocardia sp. BMG51109]|uniref:YbaB/EbfC family nucleoid-associated protein n=1 Tax=Nocardia sp. BMG51109 TaxID=1056816 RepID=UPI00046492BA|nr:YbaB/EbfC family nucleoid-associated protein [Nocardia sp. BMG51109]
MPNERLQADAATLLEGIDEQLRGIAEVQLRRSKLTATAAAYDRRIEVTVNADGVLIETKLAEDLSDLTNDEIAEAITYTAQAAAEHVRERARKLMEPLLERRNRLPKLSEIVEGAPDLGSLLPLAPEPPTALPDESDEDRPSDGSAPSMIFGRG